MKQYPIYLNGEMVMTDETSDVINPATGELIARMSTTGRPRLARAMVDAHTAWFGWRRLTGRDRGQFLHRVADRLEERREDLARTITLENGKPLAQSVGEIAMSIDHLRWFAEEARRAYGRIVPHQAEGKRNLVIKSPLGVIGAISPWNFPLALAVRKVAPALAAGNTVILKPAGQTPLSAVALAESIDAAGLPPGVFQMLVGPPDEFGREMLENPRCRKITFTGSTAVGRLLISGAAATVKPLSLELGGHAPLLVFDDADLKRAVEGAIIAKFRNTGQSCIAANRIFVQRRIYSDFVTAFAERTGQLKVGNGLDPEVEIGPLIDERGLQRAFDQIDDALTRGARLVTGGERLAGPGCFLTPTVLADVPTSALCHQDESFAPIAPITPFDDEHEAVAMANDSIYGLSAYAFTNDLSRALRLMENLEAGTIGINDGLPTTSQSPFGGIKQSGWGRELGSEGLDAFLETKHVSLGL
ncbi:MAG: NAD-dependent succinate-semialdehyde dehydrogenase [Acidobacteria bacterium]|nr:NAD-dependent succinate-semialdehyde dehydrogenase [Acidobacteriota bacterium]